jgi:ferredoxin--NADP+ reductase/benzoate/toluate 1,2-dioxygenase reductase subunit
MDSIHLQSKNQAGKHSIIRNQQMTPALNEKLFLRKIYRLQKTRQLTDETYVLRFDRNHMVFRAGQHITLGIPGNNQVREYSIYSAEQDQSLEVLIKEVEGGIVSKQLRKLIPGELLDVDGPFGYFTLDENKMDRPHLFIGTGTGVAPFRSLTASYPQLNYTLLHGVRFGREAYERHLYPEGKYVLCTSRDNQGNFHGRVTDYLRQMELNLDTMVYLCGNCDMIYDVYDLLTSRGFPAGNIKTEVYF